MKLHDFYWNNENQTINFQLDQLHTQSMMMTSWTEGCRLIVKSRSGWIPTSNDLGVRLLTDDKNEDSVELFAATIPLEIRTNMQRIVWKQDLCLYLVASYPVCRDFFVSNPGVFWFIVAKTCLQNYSVFRTIHLFEMKRNRIIEELYPELNASMILSFLNRLSWSGFDVQLLMLIDTVIQEQHFIQNTRYFNPLPVALVRAIFETNLYGFQFLEMLIHYALRKNNFDQEWLRNLHHLIRDTYEMYQIFERKDFDHALRQCRFSVTLERLHNRLMAEMNSNLAFAGTLHENIRNRVNKPFPPPPLPATDQIQPVTTAAELSQEGRDMEHCVGSYSQLVINDNYYIYRVYQPQRATLSIRKKGGRWHLDALKQYRNHIPDDECFKVVHQWLTMSQNL
ncbi:MAG: PcfJ domain-containing protein [SAR324 cluster bacterium]|nr:PcfJ domain-containing protein [SAR324 cluster bacterium]